MEEEITSDKPLSHTDNSGLEQPKETVVQLKLSNKTKKIAGAILVVILCLGAGFIAGQKSKASQIKACQNVLNEVNYVLNDEGDPSINLRDDILKCDSSWT